MAWKWYATQLHCKKLRVCRSLGNFGSSLAEQELTTICAISILGMFFCIGGRDDLSIRVKRTIPTNPFRRFIAFFFYNGTLSCLLWLLILWLATMTCLFGFNVLWDNYQIGTFFDESQILTLYVGPSLFVLYAFAYALLGVWLHRTFFPKRTPKLATLFLVLLIILPFLFLCYWQLYL